MLFFVLDLLIGKGWGQESEVAAANGTEPNLIFTPVFEVRFSEAAPFMSGSDRLLDRRRYRRNISNDGDSR